MIVELKTCLTLVFENYIYLEMILYRYIMFGRGICEKIPVERRTISRAEWRGKFSLKTGIFCKYPSQT